jgi:hypothetical protein
MVEASVLLSLNTAMNAVSTVTGSASEIRWIHEDLSDIYLGYPEPAMEIPVVTDFGLSNTICRERRLMTIQQLEALQNALNQIQNLIQAQQAQQAQVGGQADAMVAAQPLREPTKQSLEHAQRVITEALKSL